MAGYENIRDANDNRTPEERRELAKTAGKASGRARRRKADFRKTLNLAAYCRNRIMKNGSRF